MGPISATKHRKSTHGDNQTVLKPHGVCFSVRASSHASSLPLRLVLQRLHSDMNHAQFCLPRGSYCACERGRKLHRGWRPQWPWSYPLVLCPYWVVTRRIVQCPHIDCWYQPEQQFQHLCRPNFHTLQVGFQHFRVFVLKKSQGVYWSFHFFKNSEVSGWLERAGKYRASILELFNKINIGVWP